MAELGSLSSGAKMAMKIFVKSVFTIFATNAAFLQIELSKIYNMFSVIHPVARAAQMLGEEQTK